MTIPKIWILAIVLALASSGWLGIHLYGNQRARMALWQQRYDSLSHVSATRDSVFVHDTVRLTVVRHRTDSLLRVDTLFRADTVRQIVAAEREACSQVIVSCEAKVAIRDSMIHALQHKPGAPRFPSCVVGPSYGTAGKPEVSVTCGIRIH